MLSNELLEKDKGIKKYANTPFIFERLAKGVN